MPLNRPNKAELIEAVAEFEAAGAERSASSEQSSKQRFHTLVAENIKQIIERESHSGSVFEQQEAVLIEQVLADSDSGEPNQRLIKAINDGCFDGLSERLQLLDALKKIALSKLAIDNPKYPTFVRLSESGCN